MHPAARDQTIPGTFGSVKRNPDEENVATQLTRRSARQSSSTAARGQPRSAHEIGQLRDPRDLEVLLWLVAGVGGGIFLASCLRQVMWIQKFFPVVPTLGLWLCLVTAIGVTAKYSAIRSLLAFRVVDILLGIALGLILRIVQGYLSNANSNPFPSLPSGSYEDNAKLFAFVVATILAGPVVEEIYFRGALMHSISSVLGSRLRLITRRTIAVVLSTSAFVAFHAAFEPVGVASLLQIFLLGATAATLTFITSRIWPAIILHATYNGAYVILLAAAASVDALRATP